MLRRCVTYDAINGVWAEYDAKARVSWCGPAGLCRSRLARMVAGLAHCVRCNDKGGLSDKLGQVRSYSQGTYMGTCMVLTWYCRVLVHARAGLVDALSKTVRSCDRS